MSCEELALRMTDCGIDDPSSRGEAARIIERARAGDRAAFESIVVEHQRRVLMTALHMLGSTEDAEDVTQEVFLRLYRYLHRFDPSRSLTPWLYRMTVNVCRDFARKRGRAHASASGLAGSDDSVRRTDADLEMADQKRLVTQALEALTQKERAAIVLRDIEGLPTSEVARILGSTETTVRSQISAARVKIKKFVEQISGYAPRPPEGSSPKGGAS
ncbi:MAG: RNA polymerase sigma factor [Terriglobia bacterium]